MIDQNTQIEINKKEDWILVEKILFHFGFEWQDCGKLSFIPKSKHFDFSDIVFIYLYEDKLVYSIDHGYRENTILAKDYINKYKNIIQRKEKILKIDQLYDQRK